MTRQRLKSLVVHGSGILGLCLFAGALGFGLYVDSASPSAPDVATGHVIYWSVRRYGPVYVTAQEAYLLPILWIGAAVFVFIAQWLRRRWNMLPASMVMPDYDKIRATYRDNNGLDLNADLTSAESTGALERPSQRYSVALQVLTGTAHQLQGPAGRIRTATFFLGFEEKPVWVTMDVAFTVPINEGERIAVAGRFGLIQRTTFSALAYRRIGAEEDAHPASYLTSVWLAILGLAAFFGLSQDPDRGATTEILSLVLLLVGVAHGYKIFSMMAATRLLNRWTP